MKSKSDKDWKNLSSKEKNNLKTTASLLIGAIAIDLIKEHWENSTKSQKIRMGDQFSHGHNLNHD